MADLALKIIPVESRYVVIAESQFGEVFADIEAKWFEDMRLRSRATREMLSRAPRAHAMKKSIELGTDLFTGIFNGKVLALFHRTLGGSAHGHLNVRLMLADPILNSIHWEVMRFRNEFVSLGHNLFRHPFIAAPTSAAPRRRSGPGSRQRRLHILIVAVDPGGGLQFLVREKDSLLSLLRGFGDQVQVTELLQGEATPGNVRDALFSNVDIFHFAGHGQFNPENPMDSHLVLWGNTPLSIREMRAIAMSQSIGFAFLNACDTAETADENSTNPMAGESFVNMAHSLIEVGVPIVVATNHQFSDRAAAILSQRFYRSIIKYGRRVDEAIRDGRAELFIQEKGNFAGDWSAPVLYSRASRQDLAVEALDWREDLDLYRIQNLDPPMRREMQVPADAAPASDLEAE